MGSIGREDAQREMGDQLGVLFVGRSSIRAAGRGKPPVSPGGPFARSEAWVFSVANGDVFCPPPSTDLKSSCTAGSAGTAERWKGNRDLSSLTIPGPAECCRGWGQSRGPDGRGIWLPRMKGVPKGFPGPGDAQTYLEPLWTVCDDASPRRPPPSVERRAGGQGAAPACEGPRGTAEPRHSGGGGGALYERRGGGKHRRPASVT